MTCWLPPAKISTIEALPGTFDRVLRRRWPVALFVIWTLYVWITRINLAWTASDEGTVSKFVSTVVAVGLIGLAILVARALVVTRARAFSRSERNVVCLLVGATALVWAVRIPQIVFDGNRDTPFKVVHAVLGMISLGLAGLSLRVILRRTARTELISVSTSPTADR